MSSDQTHALFEINGDKAIALTPADVPTIQAFFEKNPEYFLMAEGTSPGPTQAEEEFEQALPPGWSFTQKWSIAALDAHGKVDAYIAMVSDMLAPGVWHLGLFMVSTDKHGQGYATQIYEALEAWVKASGAQWLRLGVFVGNTRAERFWQRCGYVEVRRRHGVPFGERTHDVRVMVKPLTGAPLTDYLKRVTRDHPDSA